jgi:uncharacterized repeat protein (TIGR02543 family)
MYYSDYYPYFYTSMNKSYVTYYLYTYPVYYPNPTYQLTVTSNPPGLPVSGSGQVCKGQKSQVSVTPMISANTGTRYVFIGWSGDYSGTSPTGEVPITGSMSIVANFKSQYLLTVNSQYATPSGAGWYDAGTSASASLDKSIVDLSSGVRARFDGWSGDASGQSIPTSVVMSAPRTVAAHWKNQYYVSAISSVGVASGSGWYDEGSTATIGVTSPVPAGYGSQYVFDKWVGATELRSNPAQVTVDRPITLEATWRLDQTVLYATIGAIIAVIAVATTASWYVLVRRRPAKSQSKQ